MDFQLIGSMGNIETIATGRGIRELTRLSAGGTAPADGESARESRATGLTNEETSQIASSFAVCIKNKGYRVSLEVGKLYRVIPDESAERRGYLRIVDESGEDYGYSADRFFAIDLPKPLEKALLSAAS